MTGNSAGPPALPEWLRRGGRRGRLAVVAALAAEALVAAISLSVHGRLDPYELFLGAAVALPVSLALVWFLDRLVAAAEKSEARFRLLFENAPDGIVSVDEAGRIAFANEAAARHLGYRRDELLALRITDVEMREDGETFARHFADMVEGRRLRFETQHRRKDGSPADTEVVLSTATVGGELIAYSFWRDVSERTRMEQDLRLFAEIVNAMAEGVVLTRTADATIVYTNPTFERMFGYEAGELLGKNVVLLNAPGAEGPEHVAARIQAQLASTGEWSGLVQNAKKDGTRFWCWASVTTLAHDRHGEIWVGVHQDVTDRVRAEEDLRRVNRDLEERVRLRTAELQASVRVLEESEQRFRSLFETTKDGICVADTSGRIVLSNPAMRALLGRDDDLSGRDMSEMHPAEALPMVRRTFEAHARQEESHSIDIPLERSDGTVVYADVTTAWLAVDGVPHMAGIFHDVSERRRHIQELADALRQKEVLLREVFHRVKNNLQVVASLLYLQSRKVNDPGALRIFLESRDRVMAMALVHEQLYASGDLSRIDFSSYLHRLASSLQQTQGHAARSIEVRVTTEGAPSLGLEHAVPCGLIVTELVSNAMSHAFPDGRPGRIVVSAGEGGDGSVEVVVADDGVGLPDPRADGRSGLGLQLVESLVRQIGGSLEVDGRSGARFTVRFRAEGGRPSA